MHMRSLTKSWLVLGSSLSVAVATFACSSTSSGGGTTDGGAVVTHEDGATEGGGSSSGSSSGGGGTMPLSCTFTVGGKPVSCQLTQESGSSLSAQQQQCVSMQGAVGTSCSPSGVLGCCKTGPGFESCYYQGMASTFQNTCTTQQGGTWSSTP